jgi:hypothetical protein
MTGEDFLNFFDVFKDDINGGKKDYEKAGAEYAQENMIQRIFYEGKNSYNSNIGDYRNYYSTKYEEYWPVLRNQRGLQLNFVDLKFTGELMRSITIIPKKESTTLEIVGEENIDKVYEQEKLQAWKAGSNLPMPIFTLSIKEYDGSVDAAQEKIYEEFDKSLAKWS